MKLIRNLKTWILPIGLVTWVNFCHFSANNKRGLETELCASKCFALVRPVWVFWWWAKRCLIITLVTGSFKGLLTFMSNFWTSLQCQHFAKVRGKIFHCLTQDVFLTDEFALCGSSVTGVGLSPSSYVTVHFCLIVFKRKKRKREARLHYLK